MTAPSWLESLIDRAENDAQQGTFASWSGSSGTQTGPHTSEVMRAWLDEYTNLDHYLTDQGL